MDQAYIDALVAQALGAYKVDGDEGLEKWKKDLPAPHLDEFEKHCAKPLQKAIEGLQAGWAQQTEAVEGTEEDVGLTGKEAKWFIGAVLDEETQPSDPRKKHTRDRRRTKPL